MLEQFEIMDDVGSLNNTVYRKIAENVDIKQGVFDVKVIIYNVDPTEKSTDTEVVDILVAATLGRIRFVFLMKFVNDFLAFLDPFSSATNPSGELIGRIRDARRAVTSKTFNTNALIDTQDYLINIIFFYIRFIILLKLR